MGGGTQTVAVVNVGILDNDTIGTVGVPAI